MFADWMKKEREEKGWSQKRLAAEARISHSTISLLECRKTTPMEYTIRMVCRALGKAYTIEAV